MEYTYIKSTVNLDQLISEIRNSAIKVALDYLNFSEGSLKVFFKNTLDEVDSQILGALIDNHAAQELSTDSQVTISNVNEIVPSDLTLTWSEMKNFYASVGSACMLNYVDLEDKYYVWLKFQDQKMFVPILAKGTPEATEFETYFKAKCNIPEWPRQRITTCKIGRKMHNRFITFTTADQDNYDNTDYLDVDYGDVTYVMKDINRKTTTLNEEAKETWIDLEIKKDFEIAGGILSIPESLASRSLQISSITQSGGIASGVCQGHRLRKNCMITISGANQDGFNGVKDILDSLDENTFTFKVSPETPELATGTITAIEGDDAWEVHVIAVPDIPESLGGSVHFIANSRVKWLKGNSVSVECDLNPSELKYNSTYHTNKLRVIVKHPIGAKTEFQFNARIFK